jgi:hypothetical protein
MVEIDQFADCWRTQSAGVTLSINPMKVMQAGNPIHTHQRPSDPSLRREDTPRSISRFSTDTRCAVERPSR